MQRLYRLRAFPSRVRSSLGSGGIRCRHLQPAEPRLAVQISGQTAFTLRSDCRIMPTAAKSLRKAQAAIREAGADNIALVPQAGSSPATDRRADQGNAVNNEGVHEFGILKLASPRSPGQQNRHHDDPPVKITHRVAARCLEGTVGASRPERRPMRAPGI